MKKCRNKKLFIIMGLFIILFYGVNNIKEANASGLSSARTCAGGFPAGGYFLSGYYIFNPMIAGAVVPPLPYIGALCWQSNGIMTMLPIMADFVWGAGFPSGSAMELILEYYRNRNPATLSGGLLDKVVGMIAPPVDMAAQQLNVLSKKKTTKADIPAQGTYSDKTFSMSNALTAATKEGANNLPPNVCDSLYRNTNLGGNLATKTSLEVMYNESKLNRYDYSNPNSLNAYMNSVERGSFAEISPISLFGTSDFGAGSVINDTRAARRFIENSTNPLPYPPIINKYGPAVTDRITLRNFNTGDVTLAQNSLSELMSVRSPTGKDNTLQTGVFSATGVTPVNSPIGNSIPDAVSLMRVIGLEVQNRVANYGYNSVLLTSNTLSNLKNIIFTDGIIDEIKYLQLVTRQRNAALVAAILAREAYLPGEQFNNK